MAEFKHILVPTDFGESAQLALELAIALSSRYRASLTLLHAHEVPVYMYEGMTYSAVDLLTPIREAAERQFALALADLKKRAPDAKGILRCGVPWREILGTVEDEGVDLVVVGTHGRRGMTHALLGSVAEKIVRMSPVPVLICLRTTVSSHPGWERPDSDRCAPSSITMKHTRRLFEVPCGGASCAIRWPH